MVKIFAIILLATSVYAGPATARGGGAETVPDTNFTDMPPYHPTPFCRYKRSCPHPRHYPRSTGNYISRL